MLLIGTGGVLIIVSAVLPFLATAFTRVSISGIEVSFGEVVSTAQAERKSYTEKLEDATGDDVFRYLLLINTSALVGYIAQTRLQAEQGF
jgi:hypothetical protein